MKTRSDMIDMTGRVVGRLTVTGFEPAARKWQCTCACGQMVLASGGNLRKESVRSCGCLARQERIRNKETHGMSASAEYRVFLTMRARCMNPKSKKFSDYGARGVEVRFRDFAEFIAHIGPRPSPRHSVDRIRNDGHYEIGNVRWATSVEQRNNRRDSVLIEHMGIRDTLTGWGRRLGISGASMRNRVASGWPMEKVLSHPVNHKQQRNGFRLRDKLAA